MKKFHGSVERGSMPVQISISLSGFRVCPTMWILSRGSHTGIRWYENYYYYLPPLIVGAHYDRLYGLTSELKFTIFITSKKLKPSR